MWNRDTRRNAVSVRGLDSRPHSLLIVSDDVSVVRIIPAPALIRECLGMSTTDHS